MRQTSYSSGREIQNYYIMVNQYRHKRLSDIWERHLFCSFTITCMLRYKAKKCCPSCVRPTNMLKSVEENWCQAEERPIRTQHTLASLSRPVSSEVPLMMISFGFLKVLVKMCTSWDLIPQFPWSWCSLLLKINEGTSVDYLGSHLFKKWNNWLCFSSGGCAPQSEADGMNWKSQKTERNSTVHT